MKIHVIATIFAAILLCVSLQLAAQVAINTDLSAPDNSAMLDVKSTTKGMLVPRMTLSQRNAIASPASGLMIFQTDNMPGIYVNTGSAISPSWTLSGNGNSWALSGNSGTLNSNFIGTTDNAPFNIRVNNQKAGSIDHFLQNAFFGYMAGNSTTGGGNTAMGDHTLYFNNTGFDNTAVGYAALYHNTVGNDNTATGYQSLWNTTTGSYNAAIGSGALFMNSTGSHNTACGFQALSVNGGGSDNTASGYQALNSNTTGYSNVAIGTNALHNNTTRCNLVAIGDSALYNNGIGAGVSMDAQKNTGLGSKALFSNTTGNSNTGSGFRALFSNTFGSENTANGSAALQNNTTGTFNVACGSYALLNNTTGNGNVGSGNVALYYNTTGNYNTANGFYALHYNVYGNYNTASGYYSLTSNTTGSYNVASGNQALENNHTGSYNTAIGDQAMHANTVGNWNTCIGEYTNTSVNNLAGATSLGASSITNADNKIVLGANIGGMVIGGYAPWSNLSDGWFKEDIREDVPGLAFISHLRPVTYRINTDKLQRHITAQMPDSIARHYLPTADQVEKDREYTHTGFVAQEVEASAKSIGYAFDGVNAPQNLTDNYSIAYSQFVPSLVRAVQELSAINEGLQMKNEEQDQLINQLMQRIEKLENK